MSRIVVTVIAVVSCAVVCCAGVARAGDDAADDVPPTTVSTAPSAPLSPPPPVASVVRVFVPPLRAGAGADRDMVALVDERVLLAARRHEGFDIVAGKDVQAVLDVEATRQAAGCDSDFACAAEIAGALDAPQILTGQLGRVGNTWVLSLSRTERQTMTVLKQVVREARGETPEGLLGEIDGAVDELLGGPPPSLAGSGPPVLAIASGIGVGVGVGALTVGTIAAGLSWQTFTDAQAALKADGLGESDKNEIVEKAATSGETTNTVAVVGWIAGGIIVVAGGVGLAASALGGE